MILISKLFVHRFVPYPFPKLTISDECNDIDNICEEYFQLEDYVSHEKISAPMIA